MKAVIGYLCGGGIKLFCFVLDTVCLQILTVCAVRCGVEYLLACVNKTLLKLNQSLRVGTDKLSR